ncbi:hypothetical protein BD289DRAFT_442588 [Coniella lustricola]|uniref:Uncharacterized protein n=1 Tax=Coniella lustricola TaxID=2025994 RepID=A0A2T2ZY23_9PEZI|nr:hypothetical protein BD289DRAFT_442588 [Coniella lustricola]
MTNPCVLFQLHDASPDVEIAQPTTESVFARTFVACSWKDIRTLNDTRLILDVGSSGLANESTLCPPGRCIWPTFLFADQRALALRSALLGLSPLPTVPRSWHRGCAVLTIVVIDITVFFTFPHQIWTHSGQARPGQIRSQRPPCHCAMELCQASIVEK